MFDAKVMLEELDRSVESALWPNFEAKGWVPDRVYHALRLVAARSAGGGWGVALESIEGVSEEASYVHRYGHGSVCGHVDSWDPLGLFTAEPPPSDDPIAIGGARISGPEGEMTIPDDAVTRFDLRPEWLDPDAWGFDDGKRFPLFIRAYLAEHPDAFWADTQELASGLLGLEAPEIVVVSTAFEHVVGPDGPAGDPRWKVMPSASTTYSSLVKAIAAGDASLFIPGRSNLDWRLHPPPP